MKNFSFEHMHLRSGVQPAATIAPYAGYYQTVSNCSSSRGQEDQQHIVVSRLAVEWPLEVARDPPLCHRVDTALQRDDDVARNARAKM